MPIKLEGRQPMEGLRIEKRIQAESELPASGRYAISKPVLHLTVIG